MMRGNESQTADDLTALLDAMGSGRRLKFLCFWGHRPQRPDTVDKACLSQWYPAPFQVEGVHYPTAEHYMMAEKARLFGDAQTEAKILAASHPGAAKRAGREVGNFAEKRWESARLAIVVRGNLAKFRQNPSLRAFLLSTGDRVLVEASPVDRIWGIGLAADDPQATDPSRWRGLNLLGFGLMKVREIVRAE